MSGDTEKREPDQLEGVASPEMQTLVLGHETPRAAIIEQLDRARLPTGILLHGPRGIGKATLAFDIARTVLARTGDEAAEHVAAQIAAGSHPNLRVLRRAPKDSGSGFYTVIRVEEVRGFVEELRMTRGRAGFRLAIIDAIDDCNPSASNALLKILEEPPPETLFMLVSHRPGSLLPTIRSRCHSVALRPMTDADVREVLVAADAASEGLDEAVALAGGRPRRAYEALALGDAKPLSDLKSWLSAPDRGAAAISTGIADALAADRAGAMHAFAQQMTLDWIAEEARNAAESGRRARLASAGELWDKATAQFADAEEYNLDARQTLTGVFDAIRRHALTHFSLAEAR
ncbi:MAG: AAA family ATPase [Devosia sp.]